MVKTKIIQNSIWVIGFITIGKLLSLLRDLFISSKFGANKETDSFFLANTIPSIIFSAVLISIASLIVPFYNKIKLSQKENVDIFISRLINFILLGSLFLLVISLFNIKMFIEILAPGFDLQQQQRTIILANILVLSFPLTALTQILASVSNANNNNYSLHIIPVVSAIFVVVTLYLINSDDIKILAISSVVVFVIQILIQILIVKRYFKYHFSFIFWDKNIKAIMILSLPVFLGLSIEQINNTVNTMIASKSGEGVLSALNYALRLESVINSTIITALITTSFPTLSSYFEIKKTLEFNSLLFFLIKTIIIVLLPIAIFISTNTLDIIKIIYLRGNFDLRTVELTSNVFIFFSINILFASLRELLLRIMYILGYTKISYILSGISIFITITFSLTFYKSLGIKAFGISCLLSSIFGIIFLLFYATKYKVLVLKDLFDFLKSLLIPFIIIMIMVMYINNLFYFINPIIDISFKFILSILVFYIIAVITKQKDILELYKIGSNKFCNLIIKNNH